MIRSIYISTFYRRFLVIVSILLLAKVVSAQTATEQTPPVLSNEESPKGSAHSYLRAGDKAFQKQDFAQAELEYRRAAELAPSFKALYNLGVSLANQDRSEEAAEQFERAKRYADANDEVVDASYNAGNAHLQQEDLKASIQQYVDALRANPDDVEAKQNLAEAIRMMRRMQPPPQEQQQEQQESNEEGEESKEEQQQQGPNEEESEGEQESEGDESEEPPTEEEAVGEPGQPKDLDREEAERLLQLASDQEKKTQEKIRLGEQKRQRPEKDW